MANTDVSNVVLVTVDSLRADAIGAYDDEHHTPEIDSLSERGAVFNNAFATGNWTPFSFPSILGSRPVFAETGQLGVERSSTLAAVLSDGGLSTGGFNAANGFLTSHWDYDSGFEEFESFVSSVGSSIYSRYLATHPTVEAWLQLAVSPVRRAGAWLRRDTDDRPFLDTSRMFDVEQAATSFIENTSAPFFLWIHYMDTHTPYVPAPRYIRDVSSDLLGTPRMLLAHIRTGLGRQVGDGTLADLRTLYQAAVRQVDASIGRVLETLAGCGVADETAVILAGDHGEEFQEHGHLAHYPKLYDELIRVPLVVDVPGTDSRRIDRQVGLDAIPPTVTDLLDVATPPDWTGNSLKQSVVTDEAPVDEPVVSVTVRGEEVTAQPIPRSLSDGDLLVSVRDEDWTLIRNIDQGTNELYYRPTDPLQQTDLCTEPSRERRRVSERFGAIAEEHAESLREQEENETEVDIGSDLGKRLDALGYR